MSNSISFRQLVALLLRADRVVLLLGIIVLLAAYAGFNQYRDAQAVKGELDDLSTRYRVTEEDLVFLQGNDEKPGLEQKLIEERAKPPPQALPTRGAASDFSGLIVSYPAEQQLTLTTFDRIDVSVPIGSREVPAIRHSMEADGETQALTGLLALIGDFPTAKIRELVFARSGGSEPRWHMTLSLDVFYR